MAKFNPLIEGFETDLDPKGSYDICGTLYVFPKITREQCLKIIASGSKHVREKVIKEGAKK